MYTGLTGKIMIDNQPVAYISNWSVEDTADIIEMTELGEKFKKKKAGLQSWSASADGTISFESGKSHINLFKAKHDGTAIEIMLYLKAKEKVTVPEQKKDLYFKGKGYIESLSVDLSAEDKGNISMSINGSGELYLYEDAAILIGHKDNDGKPVNLG